VSFTGKISSQPVGVLGKTHSGKETLFAVEPTRGVTSLFQNFPLSIEMSAGYWYRMTYGLLGPITLKCLYHVRCLWACMIQVRICGTGGART